MPILVVDHAFVGDPLAFGLEQFGTRDPRKPLPRSQLTIVCQGSTVQLRDARTGMVITESLLEQSDLSPLAPALIAAILVGSSYELESSCLALWSMYIGTAAVR